MSALLELAERCEKAERNPRALLEEAWVAVFVGEGGDLNGANWPVEKRERWHFFEKMLNADAFLDAAMMLVPEGWSWRVNSFGSAMIFIDRHELEPPHTDGNAATPALALCAAALRARAAQ